MEIDSATLWVATRSEESFRHAQELGVSRKLLNGEAKAAWDYVVGHHAEHGSLPSAELITASTGFSVRQPEEPDRVQMPELLRLLGERDQWKALQYGLGKAGEAIDKGDTAEATKAVLALADHLKEGQARGMQLFPLPTLGPPVLEQYEAVKSGKIGIPFPWPLMTASTMGLWPGTLTCFVGRPGSGKCVEETTQIADPVSGVFRTVKEVWESDQAEVVSWDRAAGVTVRRVSAKVRIGMSQCLRVLSRTGREIVVTPEHPFLTPEGWVRADCLAVGGTIGLPARMPAPSEPTPMHPFDVDLLAILLAEGSYTGNHTGFSTADEAILSIAHMVAGRHGCEVKRRGRYDYDFVVPRGRANGVNAFLRGLGIHGKLAKNKAIPDAVFRLSAEQLGRFLGVFWMCDGYVGKTGVPGIVLASERMVRQIQSLLLRLGIQSSVAPKIARCAGKQFPAWRLTVYASGWRAFLASVPLWGQKRERLERACRTDRACPNVGGPRMSERFWRQIRAISRASAGRWRGGFHERVARSLGRTKFQTRDLRSSYGVIKETAFRGWASVYGLWSEYRWLWESDVFWDPIVAIEPVGERQVYDLTVPETESFIGNDIIVHNSWVAVLVALTAWAGGQRKVLIVSPELNRVELAERAIAAHGHIPYTELVQGMLGNIAEKELRRVVDGLHQVAGNLVIVDNEDRLSPIQIEQAVDVLQPDLVVVDSLYMLRASQPSPGKGKGGAATSRQDRLVEIVDWMRRLARSRRIPVVGIHQLSRDGKVHKDAVRALKAGQGTGGLENAVAVTDTLLWAAHNLFALYQDKYMREDKIMLIVPLKVRRHANISSIVTKWDMVSMQFDEIGTRVGDSGAADRVVEEEDVVF